jgi:disulfide oxidoreductase YuzD
VNYLKELSKHFSDKSLAVLGQMVFTLRRPVLLWGFLNSSVLREVTVFAPHRQLWEYELDVSEEPKICIEELEALFEGERNSRSERLLYLAPSISSDFLMELIKRFDVGWVASCVSLPSEKELGEHNVAVYDLTGRKWLNVDTMRTRCWLMENILSEAHRYPDSIETILKGKLKFLALQAEFFWELLSNGVTNPEVLFDLVGCRKAEDAQIILALCKKDYYLNPLSIIDSELLKEAIIKLS